MSRSKVISTLAAMISDFHLNHPIRIGIDGVEASGKTMLADELVEPIKSLSRDVIRISVDSFHNPRNIRYRQGRFSPSGYYEDTYNHKAILSCVLLPLGPGGNLRYKPAQFDFRTDSEVDTPWQDAHADAILLFDGIFLQCPDLGRHWDFTIFVHADFNITIPRKLARDKCVPPYSAKVPQIYSQRYVPGQKIYLDTQRPVEKANVIVDNNDFDLPRMKMNMPVKKSLQLTQP